MAEFIALVKSKPGQLSLATVGPATTQHIASEMLKGVMKIDMIYTPYPGGAPAAGALVGGHVNAVLANYSEVAQQVAAGKSARDRGDLAASASITLKDVPTVAESGFPDFEAVAWFGLVATGGSPPAAIARLNAEVNKALKMPDVREKLDRPGHVPGRHHAGRVRRAHTRRDGEVRQGDQGGRHQGGLRCAHCFRPLHAIDIHA